MLTLSDCLAYCEVTDGLTEDELAALAAHERLSLIGAAALADHLLRSPEEGAPALERLLADGLAATERRGDRQPASRRFTRARPRVAA